MEEIVHSLDCAPTVSSSCVSEDPTPEPEASPDVSNTNACCTGVDACIRACRALEFWLACELNDATLRCRPKVHNHRLSVS